MSPRETPPSHEYLEIDPDEALFDGAGPQGPLRSSPLNAVIATLHEDERPLQGLAGLLDWRFRGAISEFLRSGVLHGRTGECAYLPLFWRERTLHLILVGVGALASAGDRQRIDPEGLNAVKKNAAGLKLDRIGVSLRDLGQSGEMLLKNELVALPLYVMF